MKKAAPSASPSETVPQSPPVIIAEVAVSPGSNEGEPELTLVSAEELTIARRRAGKGFSTSTARAGE